MRQRQLIRYRVFHPGAGRFTFQHISAPRIASLPCAGLTKKVMQVVSLLGSGCARSCCTRRILRSDCPAMHPIVHLATARCALATVVCLHNIAGCQFAGCVEQVAQLALDAALDRPSAQINVACSGNDRSWIYECNTWSRVRHESRKCILHSHAAAAAATLLNSLGTHGHIMPCLSCMCLLTIEIIVTCDTALCACRHDTAALSALCSASAIRNWTHHASLCQLKTCRAIRSCT
jgi:hypothetical protein